MTLLTSDPVGGVERELTVFLRRTLESVWSRGYGDGPVDRYTYPVLVMLAERGPLGLGELASRLGLTKPTMSRHVARLAGAALVTTRPDRRDTRAVAVVLTPEGVERVERVRDVRRRTLGTVLANWSEADSESLAHLLGRLNADLDRHRDEGA